MKHALAAAAAAFVITAAPALAAPDAEETVAAFHAALAAGKADEAAALLADDLTVFEEGYVEASKADYVRKHLPEDIAYLRAVTDATTRSRAVLHGDTAWVLREGRSTGSFEGKPVDRITSETVVLHLEAQGWRIVHIHWSSHKAPAGG